MLRYSPDLLIELRTAIEQLGSQGGLVSPSVYETAQVLRLHPPTEGVMRGLGWLLSQQQADGGWGVVTVPSSRDVPTLAAVITLHVYRQLIEADYAVQAGLDFLRRQAKQWLAIHIDHLTVACEMILPALLEDAARAGLVIDQSPYARLFELRRIKLAHLMGKPLPPNSAPMFSWEALGLAHRSDILDEHTGVGHSPAATAAWLHSAKQAGENSLRCAQGEAYLARAARATGTGIPGVMPMAYPITGIELSYGLYPLLLTGLLNHCQLRDVIAPKIELLRTMVEQEEGLGFGEGFVADVDDTSVAVAVLQAANQSISTRYVRRFWQSDHFYTYAHELNPSVYSNAHALHALVLSGERCELTEAFIIQQQTEGGGWSVDKWHTSWRSCTMEVIAALLPLGYEAQLGKAAQALIDDQNADGSWGAAGGALILETVHTLIALQLLVAKPTFAEQVGPALKRGRHWLRGQVENLHTLEHVWLCKEVFSPVRVDTMYKLCVLLAPELQMTRLVVSPPAESIKAKASTHEESR